MAARGILMPFNVRTKTTASPPVVIMIPSFLSWFGKFSRAGRGRFFCSHGVPEIDMYNYRHMFAQRMAMAGLKPHHRIAMAISGGPDSIALCVLTAGWKYDNFGAATNGRRKSIDGLLAIVVDHGLRTESGEEADLVHNRIIDMGIKCEVARCEWLDGRPKLGHLQEAAREKRYETLRNICIQQQIGILLVAHHADDQAELFILRLSRNSGVLGLAGMAFSSQMFPSFPDFSGERSKAHGILLVRPLLDFSKEDMYNICRGGNQQWVEDPTNRSPLYARNRIRMSLNDLSSPIFKAELQAVISACRRTRLHVDKVCHQLRNQTVTVMPHGYAVIDLGILQAAEVKDIYLTKFIAMVLQFVSQRHRPVRGNALKLLLSYLHTFPCKTSLTVANCYLCPAPGSKGTKVLVCGSINSSSPPMMELFHASSFEGENRLATSELEQILADSATYLDKFVPDPSTVPFLDLTSSESVILESQRLGILSDSTLESIISLQKEESESFKSKAETISNVSKDDVRSAGATWSKLIYPGQVGYFMNRFVLDWKASNINAEGLCSCSLCISGDDMVVEVRHMIDSDWIYLSDLSKQTNAEDSQPQIHSYAKTKQEAGKSLLCLDYAILSARRALLSLKSIPVAARRAMPVLINAKGVLLCIPVHRLLFLLLSILGEMLNVACLIV
ncbi:hypothetical protein BUALT_Bualt09G0020200 [Buddleja alternifolia]|uniref:tRNA(Ile)-lysidine synthetase n=1 Tax=Buddleja alternifolia TaxID=168488 RepID=A0AAV6X6G0_9LAMI|nr:hypothetical protein BUALT_Bualt09G0020200 [Buddleja alternifolia]